MVDEQLEAQKAKLDVLRREVVKMRLLNHKIERFNEAKARIRKIEEKLKKLA